MHPSRAAAKVAQAQEEQTAAVQSLEKRFGAFEDKLDLLADAIAQLVEALKPADDQKPADKPSAKK